MARDYYILDGHTPKKENDIFAWGEWLEKADRKVAATEITPDVTVSTVFLGFNHQFGDGPPLLFETLVFGGKMDEEMYRYSTWDDAVAGHEAVVTLVGNEEKVSA